MAGIKLLPEYGLVYDTDTGKVAPESGNMVKYSMGPLTRAWTRWTNMQTT